MTTTLGVSTSSLTIETSNPSTAESKIFKMSFNSNRFFKMNFSLVYGYGTIAIVIISALSLLAVCLLPCFKKKIYEKVLIVLTGLAIGSNYHFSQLMFNYDIFIFSSGQRCCFAHNT
jgi:hypothetical protein